MCRIEGTPADTRLDVLADALVIHLDPTADVATKEVIRYLETALPERSRKKLGDIARKGADLLVRFRGSWESWFELDIRDALRRFFAQKQPLCA